MIIIHYSSHTLCRVPHALGKGTHALSKSFAECNTRQRIFFFFQNSLPSAIAPRHSAKPVFIFKFFFCRVPLPRHSANHFLFFFKFSLPLHSVNLRNCCCNFPKFAECNGHCTRQSHSKKKLFFAFPCKQQCIYIYIRNHNSTQYIRNHIYISQTTNYVRNPQYITNHKFNT